MIACALAQGPTAGCRVLMSVDTLHLTSGRNDTKTRDNHLDTLDDAETSLRRNWMGDAGARAAGDMSVSGAGNLWYCGMRWGDDGKR